MTSVELSAAAVVVAWLALRLWGEKEKQQLLGRLACIAIAAFVAEDSALRAYDYCVYSDVKWSWFLDRVPVFITLLWPMVIHTALDLADALHVRPSRLPAFCFVVVVADAFIVEPIGVDAYLWEFTGKGAFGVPVICFLGWGCFAAGVAVVRALKKHDALIVIAGPLALHVLVLALWWGALRWVPTTTNESLRALAAWISSLALVAVAFLEKPAGLRLLLLRRLPATIWIFGLLALHATVEQDQALIVWSCAFLPPWLALAIFSRKASSSSTAPL